jgi:hypothetical protein
MTGIDPDWTTGGDRYKGGDTHQCTLSLPSAVEPYCNDMGLSFASAGPKASYACRSA